MAIKTTTGFASYLQRTTSLAPLTPLTVCFWCKLTASQAFNNCPFALYIDDTSNVYYQCGADGTTMEFNLNGNGTDVQPLVNMGTNAWHFFAMTISGTSIHNYYAPIAATALTDVASSASSASWFTTTTWRLGQRPDTFGYLDGTLAHLKIWTAALTQAELEIERWCIRPARALDVHAWYPMFSGGATLRDADFSGAGLAWTENGTITDEDGPPVSWGSIPFLTLPGPVSREQEGYRFRNDDGSEVTASWRQAQDAQDSVAELTNFRLRMLINATGDVASAAYRLEYRKTDSYDWRKVN